MRQKAKQANANEHTADLLFTDDDNKDAWIGLVISGVAVWIHQEGSGLPCRLHNQQVHISRESQPYMVSST